MHISNMSIHVKSNWSEGNYPVGNDIFDVGPVTLIMCSMAEKSSERKNKSIIDVWLNIGSHTLLQQIIFYCRCYKPYAEKVKVNKVVFFF